jgi:phage terminase small subunit
MANSRKPAQLKAVAGTARKDREAPAPVDIPLVDSIPDAPDWMPNAHAVKEWNRLAVILTANKLLTEADLGALAHLCALHGKIVQLYAAGEAPTASLIGTLRNLENDFGLSPVARGKVNPAGTQDLKGNKFAANGKRSA